MKEIALSYCIATAVFFGMDMLWLGFIAKKTYRRHLGHLMRDKINWPAAIAFYLLFIAGIVWFAVAPALASGSWHTALTNGAMFGFFTYMTYELTNYAVLKEWPAGIIVIDILWGMVLSGTVAIVTFFAAA